MTDPTATAARNIAAAFDKRYQRCEPFADNWQQLSLAAALRALTDQVMPERPLWSRRGAELTLYHEGRLDAAIRFRAEILAIAAELEGTND